MGIFQSFPYQTSLPHVSLLFVFLLGAVDCQGVLLAPGSKLHLCVIRPLALGVTRSVILGPLSSAELVLKLPHPPLNPLFFLYPVWWHHVPSQKSGSLPTTSSPTSCDEKFPDSISSTYQVYPLFKKNTSVAFIQTCLVFHLQQPLDCLQFCSPKICSPHSS